LGKDLPLSKKNVIKQMLLLKDTTFFLTQNLMKMNS
jgi:hypothetical protein